MDSNGKRQLPPPPTSPAPAANPVMGELALPARKRWRDCFLAIREDINLQASFFRRVQSRPLIFRRIFVVQLERMLRRVVSEELQRIIYNSNLPPRPPPNRNIQVRYKLVFLNKIKSPMFTTDEIKGENGELIKIEIHDINNQPIVSPENPLSSAKLKIVTLDAEFSKNEKEIWSRDEFKNSILSDRPRKDPILCGDINIRLENGVKMINDLVVKDNSSGTRSGMFRLGVMVENENERVLEGISDAFIVMERRGKRSQKPDQLLLTHNVQCLRKIAKTRAANLENNNIKTVYDFLFYYHKEQAKLRQILGIKSEDDKGWKAIIKHAMECNKEFHTQYALNCTNNLSPMVYIDSQNIISNPNVHQTQFALPNNNNYDIDMHTNRGGEFPINQEASSNLFMGTSGTRFLGSSSSQPNPTEDNTIVPDQASQFGNLFSGDVSNGWGHIGFSEIAREQSQSTFTGLIANGEPSNPLEDIFTTHDSTSILILPNETDLFMNTNNVNVNNVNGNNVSVNNGSSYLLMNSGPQFVGSSSSQQNPFEHNIISQGESSNPLEGIFATHDSTSTSILQNETDLFNNMNANNVNMNNVNENSIHTHDEFSISHEVSNNFLSRTSQTQFVGSSSSQPNPSENNIIPQGVSNGGIGLSGIAWEQSPPRFNELWIPSSEASYDMEDIFRSLESTHNNANIFGVNSFNSIRYVKGPFSPRQKAKIRAIARFNLPMRKKARLEPPLHQIGVPAT